MRSVGASWAAAALSGDVRSRGTRGGRRAGEQYRRNSQIYEYELGQQQGSRRGSTTAAQSATLGSVELDFGVAPDSTVSVKLGARDGRPTA